MNFETPNIKEPAVKEKEVQKSGNKPGAAKTQTMADKELAHRAYQDEVKQEAKREEIDADRIERARMRGLKNRIIMPFIDKLLGMQTSEEGKPLLKKENVKKEIQTGMEFTTAEGVTWTVKHKLVKNGLVEWDIVSKDGKSLIARTSDLEDLIKKSKSK